MAAQDDVVVHDNKPPVLTIPEAIFAPSITPLPMDAATTFPSPSIPVISQSLPT